LAAACRTKALAAVTRAARQAQDRVTASLVHLGQDYGAARPEPLAWFDEIAREAAQTLDPLEAVLVQLPASTLTLRGLAADLEQRAVELVRTQKDREPLARHLNNLSNCLSDLGRREEALAASDEAVRVLAPYFLPTRPPFRAGWRSCSACTFAVLMRPPARQTSLSSVHPECSGD
jgi:tetratricopeptide (TPR) repeat protein